MAVACANTNGIAITPVSAEYFTRIIQERERAKALWKYSRLKCIDILPLWSLAGHTFEGESSFHPAALPWHMLLAQIQTPQIEGRAVVTRKHQCKTPTWSAAEIPAFIFQPEIWYFDPVRVSGLKAWPMTGEDMFQFSRSIDATPRRTFGEYLLKPDSDQRWIYSLPSIGFEF